LGTLRRGKAVVLEIGSEKPMEKVVKGRVGGTTEEKSIFKTIPNGTTKDFNGDFKTELRSSV